MPVRLTREGALAVLTLDRPDAANALDVEMVATLADTATEVRDDPSIRAVLLRAEGKNFCVGGDVRAFHERLDVLPSFLLDLVGEFSRGAEALLAVEVPIVSAVQGNAAGGGLSIACLGDVIVAGQSAKFVVAYPAVGLSPDGGSSWSLPRIIGTRLAFELLLTNRVLTAEDAKTIGLVSSVVDDDAIDAEARALAQRLADGPTAAFVAGKRLLRASLDNPPAVQLELERVSIASLSGTPTGREGITAFVEKRPAAFPG